MPMTLEVTTWIAETGERIEVFHCGSGEDRTHSLEILEARHALSRGGYENVGDVVVVTTISRCDEYPELVGTRCEYRN